MGHRTRVRPISAAVARAPPAAQVSVQHAPSHWYHGSCPPQPHLSDDPMVRVPLRYRVGLLIELNGWPHNRWIPL
jgi:hypothetical protein